MRIDKNEVLRYLAYRGQALDDALNRMVDDCIALTRETAKSLYTFRIFEIGQTPDGVVLQNTDLVLPGRSISAHLTGCRSAAVLAATLGSGMDNLIRITQQTDMTKAVILDACAAACIESVCDDACEEIAKTAQATDKRVIGRFSPGYGDLPLDLQPKILDLLVAGKRIGLTVSQTNILLPRKSVTAFVGFRDPSAEDCSAASGCAACAKSEDCIYRKAGGGCENP